MSWLAWTIAVLSSSACLALWFRDVYQLLRNQKSTVESAAGQMASCREKAAIARDDPAAAAVFERSKQIYRQAVEIYNRTMQNPLIHLPAALMGFKMIS